MSVTLINEVREKDVMETEDRMEKRLKSVIGGYDQEIMESLRYWTKGDYDTGRRRGHF